MSRSTQERSHNIRLLLPALLATGSALLLSSCQQSMRRAEAAELAGKEAASPVVMAAGLGDLPAGERAYYENCAACHHHENRVGPPLIRSSAYFINAGLPAEQLGALLFEPLRVKREGSIMPAFTPEELSDQAVMELGAWLGEQTPAPAELPRLGDPVNGAALYAKTCALCHGAKGESAAWGAPLAAISGELRAHEMSPASIIGFTFLAARSGTVKNMPVFKEENMSDQDLLDIAAFMWEFPPLETPGAAAGASHAAPAAADPGAGSGN